MFFYKVGILLVFLFQVEALSEGERCSPHSDTVICRHFRNCTAAMNDVRNLRTPLICGFDEIGPIVCCDEGPTTTPAPTTPRPARRASMPRCADLHTGQCLPLPLNVTSPKTGQKAWDKCIEYQNELVYPCEADLFGSKMRVDRCGHDTGPQPHLRVKTRTSTYEQFPHMARVHIREEWGTLYNGVILSERHILTAARCTDLVDTIYLQLHITIRTGQTSESWGRYNISRIVKHPDYREGSSNHDIALLETETQMSLSRFAVPACLPVGNEQPEHATVIWDFKRTDDVILDKATLTKYQTEECAEHYSALPYMQQGIDANTQFCYSTEDPCNMVFGSPLQYMNERIQCMYTIGGLAADFAQCGRGDPVLFTRLAPYVPWIESVVWP